MNTTFFILGFGFGLVVVIVLAIISLRNGIISAKNRVKRAWADVIAYQRKKLNVIPALQQGLKDYQAYELSVLRELTALRTALTGLSADAVDVQQLQRVEQHSRSLLAGMRVAVESYPVLKTSELYAGWMRELSEAEENVAAAVVIFNAGVQDFNDRIQQFPGSAVNSWCNRERPLETFSDSAAQAGFEYRPTCTN